MSYFALSASIGVSAPRTAVRLLADPAQVDGTEVEQEAGRRPARGDSRRGDGRQLPAGRRYVCWARKTGASAASAVVEDR